MANSNVQIMKLDLEAHRTLKALIRAINRQTDTTIQIENSRQKFSTTLVSGGEEGITQEMREEAVAEGDDVSILSNPHLTRHRVVLEFVGDDIGLNCASFARPTDEEATQVYEVCYRMPQEMYDDMGRPTTITLTVEPGDKLNG